MSTSDAAHSLANYTAQLGDIADKLLSTGSKVLCVAAIARLSRHGATSATRVAVPVFPHPPLQRATQDKQKARALSELAYTARLSCPV